MNINGTVRGIFKRRPPSEREIAEKKLKKSRIPELHPQPGYEGQAAMYIVKHPSGHSYLDRWETGRVIRAGVSPAEHIRRVDEEENRFMREDTRLMDDIEDRATRRGRSRS